MTHLRNGEFGRYTTLKVISSPSTPTISSTTANNNKVPKPTKIIRISESLYQRFVDHSHRFYNVESYEVILSDLLDCYSKQHEPDYSNIHSNE